MFEDIPVASTEAGWQSILKDKTVKVVRNLGDWKAALACDTEADHPLQGCDKDVIEKFTSTLEFENGGLAHANYRMLRDTLTVAQFDRLWAFFGISPLLMKDYNNKECAKRATCSSSITDICTSNCYSARGNLLSELIKP